MAAGKVILDNASNKSASPPLANWWAEGKVANLFRNAVTSLLVDPIATIKPRIPTDTELLGNISKPRAFEKDPEKLDALIDYVLSKKSDVLGTRAAKKDISMDRGYAATLGISPTTAFATAARKDHKDDGFSTALNFVLDIEKGRANHAKMNGGDTIFGIASRSHKAVFNEVVDNVNRNRMGTAIQMVSTFYRNEFWNKLTSLDELPLPARIIALDTAVLHGHRFANKLIEASGGDPETMLKMRIDRTVELAESSPHNKKTNFNGWMNRIAELAKEVYSGPSPEPQANSRTVQPALYQNGLGL